MRRLLRSWLWWTALAGAAAFIISVAILLGGFNRATPWALIITAPMGIVGVVAALVGASSERLAALYATTEEVTEKSLEERLDQLSKSMRESARLVEQVSAELEARTLTARQLEEDAQQAKAIAESNKEQKEAFRRMLDEELKETQRRIRGDSIKLGVGSFLAGSAVTYLVTLLVHPVH